jgi:DNA invertase Pin-like site-specific DNA recombinase
VRSLNEAWPDTSDPHMRELLISVFAWLAAQERRRRSEQTKAGLRRAWAKGKKSGRPTIDQDKAEAVRDYLSQKKHSYREIAELVGVGSATVQRINGSRRRARRPRNAARRKDGRPLKLGGSLGLSPATVQTVHRRTS